MPATDDLLQQQLVRMRAAYLATLPGRLGDVEALWSRAGRGDAAALEAFGRKIHQLAGNAGTFGFAEVSRSAAAIDAIVGSAAREGRDLSAAETEGVGRELASLAESVRASGQAGGP